MSLMDYSFPNTTVDCDRLTKEIRDSSIVTALDNITVLGPDVTIWFKNTLSEGDETELNTIVSIHIPTPLLENVVQSVAIASQPEVVISAAPPYGSKTIIVGGVVKKLYARSTGFQQALSIGANTITYTATYPWVKLLGVEVVNCEALDTVDFKVYDTPAGTYSGYPNVLLNQFSYSNNLPKDYYVRMSQFDADMYAGMVIKVEYNSVSAKTVGINLIMNEVK